MTVDADSLERFVDAQAPVYATALGEVDALKLRSSLTLFAAPGAGPLFVAALERWFGGIEDPATLRLLNREG